MILARGAQACLRTDRPQRLDGLGRIRAGAAAAVTGFPCVRLNRRGGRARCSCARVTRAGAAGAERPARTSWTSARRWRASRRCASRAPARTRSDPPFPLGGARRPRAARSAAHKLRRPPPATPERLLGRESPCPACRAAARARAGSARAARRARGCASLGVGRARALGTISSRPMCSSAGARGLDGRGATRRARASASATAEGAESAARGDGVRFLLRALVFPYWGGARQTTVCVMVVVGVAMCGLAERELPKLRSLRIL